MRLATDISAAPEPLATPTEQSPRVLVVGGGVIGLTTAWMLLDKGYQVTIISQQWASFGSGPRLTSQIAAAVWELPPAGCGPQVLIDNIPTVQKWALESLHVYRAIHQHPQLARAYGLQMRTLTSFHLDRIDADSVKSEKVKLIEANLEGVSKGTHLIDKYGVNEAFRGGLLDANELTSPMIDTDAAMAFLMRIVRAKGARLETDTIIGDLFSQEDTLLDLYRADALVNATGVGARDITQDERVYPMRGATLRVINDGSDFPPVHNSMFVLSATDQDGSFLDLAMLHPRNDEILLLGSLFEETLDLNLTPDSPQVQAMRRNCEAFMPALRNARLDPRYPIAQDIRPMRLGAVRVERDERKTAEGRRSRTVHSYGHGGAGWTLAFGSARETVRLVEKMLTASASLVPSMSSEGFYVATANNLNGQTTLKNGGAH